MSISKQEVLHIAQLAQLELSDERAERFGKQLGNILAYVEQLNELDTTGVEPTSHVLAVENVLRSDSVSHRLSSTEVFQNAPDQDGAYFKVPQILEGDAS